MVGKVFGKESINYWGFRLGYLKWVGSNWDGPVWGSSIGWWWWSWGIGGLDWGRVRWNTLVFNISNISEKGEYQLIHTDMNKIVFLNIICIVWTK